MTATPEHLNPNKANTFRKELKLEEYLKGILASDRGVLARAITLVESKHPKHRKLAEDIIEACLPYSGKSFRLGITGVPGVGKSSFIESFGGLLIDEGRKVAVLAIDPSSERSRGSILGDKTRMENLSSNKNAFIRPSPASNALGGVARKTRESIILCEAAGYDYIIVETVGVGQSEIAVHSMVDFFLLLLLPGAGDELQGIKRGIVEMADMIAINKADKASILAAKKAKIAYANALHLFPPSEKNWIVPIQLCSSLEKTGLKEIVDVLKNYHEEMKKNGQFLHLREKQNHYWLMESLTEILQNDFFNHSEIKKQLKIIKSEVASGKASPFRAAEELISFFKSTLNGNEGT